MRQPGFYWVKKGEWEVSEFTSFHNSDFGGPYGWFRTAYAGVYQDSDFDEIDERRIDRKVDKPCEPEPPTAEEIKMDAEYRALFGRYLDIDKNPEWT